MGDPKKIRKKYSTPAHPWQKTRIEEEIALKKEFGLTNKKEIWSMTSILKNFKNQVKKLNALTDSQAEREKEQLKNKLLSYGLLKSDSPLDSILGLETKDVMERRLQTILFKKNLAKTISQARQFIVHRHVTVAGKKVTAPSYIVRVNEEPKISFAQSSSIADSNHPERYENLPEKHKGKKTTSKKSVDSVEEVAAFEEVPKNEEEIIKDIKPKKETESKKADTQNNETAEDKNKTESEEVKEQK